MTIAPLLPDESQRLLAVKKYQLLDTLPEEGFDEIARLATAVCQTPIALISLVDEKRQWFKSKVGLEMEEASREFSFCVHAMAKGKEPYIIPDTQLDERFRENPLVKGSLSIAFYAGIPLLDKAGHAIGSLCVMDHMARELSQQQIESLKVLARMTLEKMEAHKESLVVRQKEDVQEQERMLLDNAPVLVVKTDDTLQIAYANNSQYNRVGQSVLNLFPISFRSEAEAQLREAFQSNRVINFQFEQDNAGQCGWYYVRAKRITHGEEKDSLLLLIEDVTKAKGLEHEKDRLVQELSARVDALQQYNYIVSHNLRGPVANILGLSDLLLNMPEYLSEKEKNLYLRKVYATTLKLDGIIQDLTQILALQNPLEVKKDTIDFQEMIEGTLSSLQTFVDEAQANVQVVVDPTIGGFASNRSYIQSILYNLINNAIKHRALNRQLQISVQVYREVGKVIVKVSDNGQGINLHKHGGQLFGLYQRFNPYVEGRGLGLHMTKTQVDSLGGTIEVESKEGRGTTFTVTFEAETGTGANEVWMEEAC